MKNLAKKPTYLVGGRLPYEKRQIAPSQIVGAAAPLANFIPVAGPLVSAGLGVAAGLLGAGEQRSAERELERKRMEQMNQQRTQEDTAALQTYNTTGNQGQAGYYAGGGTIHIKPENRGKFNALKKRTGKSTEELTHSKNPLTRKRAIFAQNAAKWHHADGGNIMHLRDYLAEGGRTMTDISNPTGSYNTTGGDLQPLNSNTEEVVGNSHGSNAIDGQYGVTLEEQGEPVAEVEGGEVIQDGNQVYSNRLAPPGSSKSYAELAKILAKKTGKLETKLDNTADTKDRNGIERMLAGQKMANEELFRQQEMSKQMEGQQILAAMGGGQPQVMMGGGYCRPMRGRRVMAYGDEIQPSLPNWYGKNPPLGSTATANPYWYDTNMPIGTAGLGNTSYSGTNPMNNPAYDSTNWYGGTPPLGSNSYTNEPPAIPSMGPQGSYYAKTSPVGAAGYTSPYAPAGAMTPGSPEAIAASTATTPEEKLPGDPTFGGQLAPRLIDNAGNFIINRATPKLPRPILSRAPNMETTVNANPQLAAIQRGVGAANRDIQGNTSNSAIARANMASNRLEGSLQQGNVLANKAQTEIGLRNQDARTRAELARQNNALLMESDMLNFQRKNEIQARDSANLANLSGDIADTQERMDLRDMYSQVQAMDLLNDPTGEKARTFARNPELAVLDKNRKVAAKEAARRAAGYKDYFSSLDAYRNKLLPTTPKKP